MTKTTSPSLTVLLLVLFVSTQSCLGQQAPIRINCGGESYTDGANRQWLQDDFFKNGIPFDKPNDAISGTDDDRLLQTERYSWASTLCYDIPVAPGVYDVRLQFSENYSQAQGEDLRVFHIFIEGMLAMKNVDIYKEASSQGYTRVQREFRAQAVGDSLKIDFVSVKQNAKVNTIEILPSSRETVHPDIRAVLPVLGEPDPKGILWADSYSVNGNCYCVTTYDHDIDTVLVDTPLGWMTVKDACEIIGPGPGITDNTPVYNDVQCGNGPPNNAGDEHTCPGRTDLGREGCGMIGPKWNFDA